MVFTSIERQVCKVYPVCTVFPVSPVSHESVAVDWEDCEDRVDWVDSNMAPPFEVQQVPAPPEQPRFSCGRRSKSSTGLRGADPSPPKHSLAPRVRGN